MKRIIAGCLALAMGIGIAHASGTASGTVTYYSDGDLSGNEVLYVKLSTESNASCASADRFAISSASPEFKTVAAMIIGAYLSGSTMYIDGAGTCTTSSGSEDISSVCYAGGC
jgi:hypothetical protein